MSRPARGNPTRLERLCALRSNAPWIAAIALAGCGGSLGRETSIAVDATGYPEATTTPAASTVDATIDADATVGDEAQTPNAADAAHPDVGGDSLPADAGTDPNVELESGPVDANEAGDSGWCALGAVTFRMLPPPADASSYCAEIGNGGKPWLALATPQDAEVPLWVPAWVPPCSTCMPFLYTVGNLYEAIPPEGVAFTWHGMLLPTSTSICDASAWSTLPPVPETGECFQQTCAAAGHYVARMCASPTCSMQQPTCVDVPFDYPTSATVTGVIGP